MKDHAEVVVYVGKAVRLPDRVSSYFVPSADLGYKKQPMLDVVHDLDFIVCEGEWEALLTENRLIKDLKPPPRFNVRLKDGKSFPYLVITQREDFPRVMVSRSPKDPDLAGAKVFGPFTDAGSLRVALGLLQRVFRFRTCALDITDKDPKNRHFRPCILASIGHCTAPCADRVGKEDYARDVDRFVRFLGSKRSAMLRELRQEMEDSARALRYEHAAALRDQIRAIERLDQRASRADGFQPETELLLVDPEKSSASLQRALGLDRPIRCIEGFDIAHLQGHQTVASKVCFADGRPFKQEYRQYKVAADQNDDYASIREVVSRRYGQAGLGHELYPDLILIDGGLGQLHAALEAFAQLSVRPPMVVSLAKKDELVFVQERPEPLRLSRHHLGLRLLQAVRDEAHRFAQAYHHLLRRKKTLGQ
ncbi:MAG: excinuclease ABC subunit C [Planctomyces sp.]|nr:excinuclease ABC subunit C [Planctomyces sp.]